MPQDPFYAPIEDAEPCQEMEPRARQEMKPCAPLGLWIGLIFALIFEAIAFVIGAIAYSIPRWFPVIIRLLS